MVSPRADVPAAGPGRELEARRTTCLSGPHKADSAETLTLPQGEASGVDVRVL